MTKRALKAISVLATKYGLTLYKMKLAKRETRIHTFYAGGSRLRDLLDSVDVAFAQCGSKGEWIAVLPADRLMQLLETESLQDSREE